MTPAQQTTTLAAGAGGLLWAIANAFAIVLAPSPPDRRSGAQACAEAFGSIVAALIGGYSVAPAICIHLHVTQIETVKIAGQLVCASASSSGGQPRSVSLMAKTLVQDVLRLGSKDIAYVFEVRSLKVPPLRPRLAIPMYW